jgi:hypothetical protein
LWTYRVWWHFLADVIGTMIFAIALYHLWREREHIKATYRPCADTTAVPEPQPLATAH